MTYANPAYLVGHHGASIGYSAITTKYATEAGFGKERLIDTLSARLMIFDTSQADHDVEFDLNSLTTKDHDRCLIPPGHNLNGVTVRLYTGATTPAANLIASVAAVAGQWIDLSYATQTARYVRVNFNASGAWELGELWIGKRITTIRGVSPGWEAPYQIPVEVIDFPTREVVSVLGARRRGYDLRYEDVNEAGADETALVQLAQIGRGQAFVFWPPTSGASPFIARMTDDPQREQDSPNPLVKVGHRYRFRLLEQTS